MSVVLGHLHSNAGVIYNNNGHNQIFGMNAGCLIDRNSVAFRYGALSKTKQVLGCGVIESSRKAYFEALEV